MPTTQIGNLQVDPPLSLDAKFRYDVPDRAYLDGQIRGVEQHLVDSGGLNGTQCCWFVVDGASAAIVIGDVVCLAASAGNFRNVTKAIPAALAAAGRALGIAMNPAAPGVNVRVAIAGTLPTSITGLSASANLAVRISATARCQQVASFAAGDYPIGFGDTQGNFSLLPLASIGAPFVLAVLAVANLPTGGPLGTAAATVDIYSSFDVNQTTAAQSISIPSPTNTTTGREVSVSNVGSQSFTMLGATVAVGTSLRAKWTGAAWSKFS